MTISNLKFKDQNTSIRDNIPLFQFNDTVEVVIDTLTIQDNLLSSIDKRRNLQSKNGSDSYMNSNNK